MKDRSSVRLDNNEKAMQLAVKVYEKTYNYLKLFDTMLQKGVVESYSLILVMSKYSDLGNFLRKKKRRSDLLIEIDDESQIHTLICSETEVGGGFYFYKRLSDELYRKEEYEMIASVLSIESPINDIWEIIYDVTSPFIELGFNGHQPQDIVLNRYKCK